MRLGVALAVGASAVALGGCAQEIGQYAEPRGVLGIAVASNIQVQDLSGPGLNFEEEREVERLAADFAGTASDLVYFEFDQAKLTPEARDALQSQAAWLSANPRAAVRIYGHTDLVGADPYNDRLGLKRARNVASYLQSLGVAPNRIQSVSSFGEREPVVVTPDSRAEESPQLDRRGRARRRRWADASRARLRRPPRAQSVSSLCDGQRQRSPSVRSHVGQDRH